MATSLSVEPRTETGNGPAGRLRSQGLVPGILYNPPGESIPFQVAEQTLRRALIQGGGRENGIDLSIGDEAAVHVTMVDWQRDPVRGDILHVDFRKA